MKLNHLIMEGGLRIVVSKHRSRENYIVVPVWKLTGARPRKKLMFWFKPEDRKKTRSQLKIVKQEEIPCYAEEGQPFVLYRPSINGLRPTNIKEGNLLCLIFWLKKLVSQKHPYKSMQNIVQPTIWAVCGPVKLNKINHHTKITFENWVALY